jgi:lipoyl(octanoyl) transferase
MSSVIVRYLGIQDYPGCLQRMQAFNAGRKADTADEIWLLQHPPVFTLGLNGKSEHVLDAGDIPLVQTDRGGQVTYHGPGQLLAYLLLDVRRNRLGIRQMVSRLEQAVIELLAREQVSAHARKEAPGVYVGEAKIAALGLRVKGGGTYHGLSLNVNMDLAPFQRINPCGYPGLAVMNMADLGLAYTVDQVSELLLDNLCRQFEIEKISKVYESETDS